MVGWALFPQDQVSITGDPVCYQSSAMAQRMFCGVCGTGLFYLNPTVFPGKIDIQLSTLDDPNAFPPAIHVQFAEAAPWMEDAGKLPRFARYPGGE